MAIFHANLGTTRSMPTWVLPKTGDEELEDRERLRTICARSTSAWRLRPRDTLQSQWPPWSSVSSHPYLKHPHTRDHKKALLSQRWPRNAPYIWVHAL